MPVIDTSWLLAFYLEDDAHHAAALEASKKPGLHIVPGVVLAEFIATATNILTRKDAKAGARQTVRALVRQIVGNAGFQIEPSYPVSKSHAVFDADQKLSYVDAVGATVALVLNQALLTFDEHQQDVLARLKEEAGAT